MGAEQMQSPEARAERDKAACASAETPLPVELEAQFAMALEAIDDEIVRGTEQSRGPVAPSEGNSSPGVSRVRNLGAVR